MKSIKELREYFAKAEYKEIQELLETIFRLEIAANAEYPLYFKQTEELRNFLKKILGWDDKNQKKIEEIAQEYKDKVEDLLKEKKPLLETVTINEKKSILNKIMGSKITKTGLIIGVGTATGMAAIKLYKSIKRKRGKGAEK